MKHILVVDDESMMRRVLCLILEQQGYDCVDVRNGEEALSVFDSQIPIQLLITDNQMPVMNGLQLIDNIKNSSSYRHVPIILFSGHLSEEAKVLALRYGISGMLSKPLNVSEMLEAVESALKEDGQRLLKSSCL